MYETNEAIHNEFNYAGEIQFKLPFVDYDCFFDVYWVKGQSRVHTLQVLD